MALIEQRQADSLRDLPLAEVAARLGLTGKREGRSVRYKSEKFNLVVTGQEFFDNDSHHGAYGAISLVMHVLNLEYRQAVAWLSGQHHAISAANNTPPLFPDRPPKSPRRPSFAELLAKFAARTDGAWPAARNYLLRRRALPAALVDKLHADGQIYANDHLPNPSLVFIHRDLAGQTKGFTLRSTYDPAAGRKKFCPCMGDKETAWFYLGDLADADIVVVVESPIDAMSYAALRSQAGVAIVSLAGWHLPDALFAFVLEAGKKLIVALDHDREGTHGWHHILVRYLFQAAATFQVEVFADTGSADFMQFRLFLKKPADGATTGYSIEDVKKLLGIARNQRLPVQVLFPDNFQPAGRAVPTAKDWNLDLIKALSPQSQQHLER
jgi:hypothetical protein